MRKGWRLRAVATALGVGAALLALGPLRADTPRGESPVRMSVEIEWSRPELPASGTAGAAVLPVDLEITAGRILGAVASSPDPAIPAPAAREGSTAWRLSTAPAGRFRARVEAPLSAVLMVRMGTQATAFPLQRLLEAPQQSVANAPVEIRVARLAWDTLELDPGTSDGTAAPGAVVPLIVGLNVLTPEPGEALVRLVGELKRAGSDEAVGWNCDQTQVVATDAIRAPVMVLNVTMPREPGTYVLSLQASWEPILELKGSRIGRLFRRRESATWPGPSTALRRTTLVVTGSPPPRSEAKPGSDPVLIDSVELDDPGRGHRLVASGRAPAPAGPAADWPVPDAALVEAAFRDRLRGWILGGPETGTLGPADAEGLAWSAVGLKVAHPGRAHRLTVTLAEGDPEALGVALIDPGRSGTRARVVLDTGGHVAAAPDEGAARTCSWTVWPGAEEPVLVLVNRAAREGIRVGSVKLEECPDGLAAATLVAPPGAASRGLGLVLEGLADVERFAPWGPEAPRDSLGLARNLASYLEHCGLSLVVLPDGLADRAWRRGLEGQAAEDTTGPDRLEVLLRVLGERKLSAWLELDGTGPWPGLPAPTDPAAVQRGLVRLDDQGRPDTPAAYWPLHADVSASMKRRVAEALAPRARNASLAGVLIRMGDGPTLLGSPESGLDDATYARFVAEMFDAEQGRRVPGRGTTEPGRYATRRTFLAGPGSTPWLLWRSRQLGAVYAGLADAAKQAAPGALVAVATPLLDRGPAGREARKADQANQPPLAAWKAVGLDLEQWPRQAENLVLLRGLGGTADPLAGDLAAHPELDAPIAAWPRRGLVQWPLDEPARARDPGESLRLRVASSPWADPGDEPLGHGLAVLDARWMLVASRLVEGREAALSQFARVFRALPDEPKPGTVALTAESGVAVRTWAVEGRSYLGLANDTPYTIRVDATLAGLAPEVAVDDLGRGWRLAPEPIRNGRRLVLDLAPYGVAAVRVAAPEVALEPVVPHPLDDLDAPLRSLVALRDRLAQEATAGGPLSGTFEPATGSGRVLAQMPGSSGPAAGWTLVGDEPNGLAIDAERPHAGVASLRVDARTLPVSVAGPSFLPPTGPEWLVRAWFRSETPDARIRVWIEGESQGRPVAQVAPLDVGSDWSERRIRIANLPPGGLQRARLRVEPLGSGRLWIDDVGITGPGGADAHGRAQLVLMKALQAHRERRFGDFARLAHSRWVQGPAAALAPAAPAGATAHATAPGDPAGPAPIRTGNATDLPPGRRLR